MVELEHQNPPNRAAQQGDLGRWGNAAKSTRTFLRAMREQPLGAFGALTVIVLVLVGLFADQIAPYNYDAIDIPNRLQGPSSDHYFGTDEQGRDVFSRVIYGARTSTFIALSSIAVMVVLASMLGIISGYYGGTFDILVQRIVDVWLSMPGLIFVIFVISLFGGSTLLLAAVIGFLMAAAASRVIRSATIAIRDSQFVEGARAVGANDFRIIVHHLLPNVAAVIIISASVQVGSVIILETSLSFLGFGAPPPAPSWGRMLQEAQAPMQQHPYLAVFPGIAIALTVFGLNMFGDALRDILDPRMRGTR